MNAKQEDVLREMYTEWVKHPVTKQLVEGLKNHREKFVKELSQASRDPNVSEVSIRRLGIGISDVDAFMLMIVDYPVFKNLTVK